MAILGTITKQPWEAQRLDIDYGKEVGTLTLDDLVADVTVPAGMTLISQARSGSVLQLYLGGGTDGQVYTWRVRSTLSTAAGELARLEDEFIITVADVVEDTELLADAVVVAAGTTLPVIARRPGDARDYVIDFGPILRLHEVLSTVSDVTPGAGIAAGTAAVVQGRYVRTQISGGTVPNGSPYQDYDLKIVAATNRGSVQGNVTVRVYP